MSDASPTAREIRLPAGTIRYRDGGSGEPIVFAHGLLVDGTLWRKVTPQLDRDFRCIVPDLPLGSHRVAMEPGADLSPPGVARILAEFIEALDLEGVTLVGNDTGGAIAQLVATRRPERIGRLVLTPCDAYENFLPPFFRPLQCAARVPGLLTAMVQPMRLGFLQRTPLGFGLVISRPNMDPEVMHSWLRPFLSDAGVRRDTAKFLRAVSSRYTIEAAERLPEFDRPALIAWTPRDRVFPLRYGERLAAAIPNSRLVEISGSRGFMPEDQPERLAEEIAGFIGATSGTPSSSGDSGDGRGG